MEDLKDVDPHPTTPKEGKSSLLLAFVIGDLQEDIKRVLEGRSILFVSSSQGPSILLSAFLTLSKRKSTSSSLIMRGGRNLATFFVDRDDFTPSFFSSS